MSTILICTDFSNVSRNALAYTCNLVQKKHQGIQLLLLHVFTVPANYSGEGLSLVTINDEWRDAENQMEEEMLWVKEHYPDLDINSKLTTGRLLAGLKEQIVEIDPFLVVIGASGNFEDMWSWDRDILDLLRDASVPVLTVPKQVSFTPIRHIGYACNLKDVSPATPFKIIKSLVQFTGASLHVLTVTTPEIKKMSKEQNEALVHDMLNDVDPEYHMVEEAQVIGAIGHFVQEQQINLLLVTPRRHGVWETIFHKSRTKELMRLNTIPIVALHKH